ncbi:hypothetical protein B0J18DRAFT_209691 [Chaetomium sp. MPI-SDFR-AT-0129]|nr:hypothetical protein B0J18DRAFT_209691 [Chaetomium sp. MPI-SDFR-AT-0129]
MASSMADAETWTSGMMMLCTYLETQAPRPKVRSSSSNPKPEPSDPGIDADVASAPTSPLWKSVASLFSRPWFWRIWVIQEVVLAQSAVVKWGHAEMDWRWIGLASAILRTNYSSICEVMKMGGVYNAYFMFRLSTMSDLPPLTLSFIQLLRLTRQFEVTDVRDRIYGLLGIRTTDNDPEAGLLFLRPDYSISECELWKRLATKVIGESQNLSLLSSVQYTTGGLEAGNSASERLFASMLSDVRYPTEPLPSWVPHWDFVYRSTLAPWDHDDRFAAAKDFPLHVGSPMGSDNLLVEGIKIGVVGRCCGYMWHQADTSLLEAKAMGDFFASDDGLHLLARTLTAGRNAYGSLTAADSDRDSESCLADLAAYILDCDRNEREGREKRPWSTYHDKDWTARSYQKVFERHPQLKDRLGKLAKGGDMSRFRNTVVSICKRRRLFITLNGYLGLGSDSVVEGDVVCVLSGADLPFVLRPVLRRETKNDDKNTEELRPDEPPQIDHYVLVGECYVEGLMNGEAIAEVTGGSGPSEFSGPVPFQLLEEDILSAANEPEEVITQDLMAEIKRTKMKQARLDAGDLFTPAMVEAARRTRAEKQWFDIH